MMKVPKIKPKVEPYQQFVPDCRATYILGKSLFKISKLQESNVRIKLSVARALIF